MLDETKEIIELAYMLSRDLKGGKPINDIEIAGPYDFFSGLWYDKTAEGLTISENKFYKLIKRVTGGGQAAGRLTPLAYFEGRSYTVWAVDPLGMGGELNALLMTFDGTSKQFFITSDQVDIIITDPVISPR